MPGALADIPSSLPALRQAQLISDAAVNAGFEWDTLDEVWDKVFEEIDEFKEAQPGSRNQLEEMGDILFTLVNVARKQGIDAESALEATCEKFRQRWSVMEQLADQEPRCSLSEMSTQQLLGLWKRAKTVLGHASDEGR